MLIPVQNFWQKNVIFFSMLLMLAALFISRATFSTATIFFVAACCINKNILSQLKASLTTPITVVMMLLFFIPLVSGLWSSNSNEWVDLLRVKLPLLLFPVAFAGAWQLSRQQWKFVLIMIIFTALAGSVYSFTKYMLDYQAVHKAYLQAKVIDTPFQNDHLRFSLFIALAFFCSLFLIDKGYRALRVIGVVLAFWFALYLHVLSARTGLLCLYAMSLAYLVRLIFQRKGSVAKWALIACVFLLPLLAWWTFPTFQNRVRYFVYDHSFASSSTYLAGSNDGNRILSLKAGWDLLKENPGGVGAGDIRTETHKWYAEKVPGMVETDKLYPSSEWLMHGAMAGWAGVFLFTVAMALPLFLRMRYRFFWLLLNVSIMLSLVFDTGLGVQYGVFLYAFFILAFWKWSKNGLAIADTF